MRIAQSDDFSQYSTPGVGVPGQLSHRGGRNRGHETDDVKLQATGTKYTKPNTHNYTPLKPQAVPQMFAYSGRQMSRAR